MLSKIEMPNAVRNSKGPQTWQVWEWMISTLEQMQVPTGTGPGVSSSYYSLCIRKNITEPSPFYAIGTSTISNHGSGGVTVPFNSVGVNVGNAWSTSLRDYIVPSDGVYTFHWTCQTKKNEAFSTDLAVNGVSKARNYLKVISKSLRL